MTETSTTRPSTARPVPEAVRARVQALPVARGGAPGGEPLNADPAPRSLRLGQDRTGQGSIW